MYIIIDLFFVGLGDLSSAPFTVVVQAWTKNGNHSRLFYEKNEAFFNAFKQHNISFPSTSMEVKLKQQ